MVTISIDDEAFFFARDDFVRTVIGALEWLLDRIDTDKDVRAIEEIWMDLSRSMGLPRINRLKCTHVIFQPRSVRSWIYFAGDSGVCQHFSREP